MLRGRAVRARWLRGALHNAVDEIVCHSNDMFFWPDLYVWREGEEIGGGPDCVADGKEVGVLPVVVRSSFLTGGILLAG
jgi:hypothetical protein